MTLVVDIHALQTVPPSLINRDDTGAPKSAIFGGVPRQRVSSQSWKRAIRKFFEEQDGEHTVGFRSRELPELIAQKALELDHDLSEDAAINGVRELFKKVGKGIKLVEPAKPKKGEEEEAEPSIYPKTAALLFLSPSQIERAAQAVVDKQGEKFSKAEAQEILDTEHSIDVAMFGRMLADAPAFNVDASVQVAHAIGVHESQPEFDYYTAVDDVIEDAEETGAGMIGTTQMMSSTLYRFATVNVEALGHNLGNADLAREATAKFIKAFVQSMPTGKQNTFANNTLPELVYVAVRDTRSVSLVNAFEEPVEPESGSRVRAAALALAEEEAGIERVYGMKPRAAFVFAPKSDLAAVFADVAEDVTASELEAKLQEALSVKESD